VSFGKRDTTVLLVIPAELTREFAFVPPPPPTTPLVPSAPPVAPRLLGEGLAPTLGSVGDVIEAEDPVSDVGADDVDDDDEDNDEGLELYGDDEEVEEEEEESIPSPDEFFHESMEPSLVPALVTDTTTLEVSCHRE
jgi:hypothetical protein